MTLSINRMLFCSILLSLAMATGSCSRDDPPDHMIVETFADGSFDQSNWRIDPRRLPEASFLFDEQGLAIHVPAQATGGAPAELKSQFKVGGNFEIALDYSIESLPPPEEGYNNLEVSLYGAGGSIAFMRTEQAERGAGFAIWHEPSDENANTFWRFSGIDADAAGDAHSQLLLRRRGAEITCLARMSPDEEFTEVGTLEYPASLDSLQFRVVGKPVSQPIDVRFHEVRVAADNIWHRGSVPDSSWQSGDPLRIISVVLAILLGIAGVFLLYRYYSQS